MTATVQAGEVRGAWGNVGLYLFAVSAWAIRPLAVLGCLLMLWALWRDRGACWPLLRRDPLTWLLLGLAGYALLRAASAALAEPAHWQLQFKDAARVVYLAGIIPVAWYLRADEGRLLRCWLLAAAGFLLARLCHLGELLPPAEPRPGLGLESIPFGYYAATVLLGLLLLAPAPLARLRGGRRLVLTLALLLLCAALLQAIILSQSRAVWLSLLPLLGLSALICFRQLWRRGERRAAGAVLLALIALGGLLLANQHTFGERLAAERNNWSALFAGNLDAITTGQGRAQQHSVGIRVAMVQEGLARWREAPLLGHGPAAGKLTLRESEVFLLPRFNDYHNVPIDLLVRYGLVGLLLCLACLLLLADGFRRGWRAGRLAPSTALFLACALTLLLTSMLSNFRLLNWDFRYWLFLLAAPLASYRYYCRERS